MKRWWVLLLAGVVAWHGMGVPADAQVGGYTPPYQPQPTISPYLNLNRAGTSAGINYFGMVRPQLQTAQQLQNLQSQQGVLANEIGGNMIAPGVPTPIATTGHPVYYFDYSRYFPLGGLPNFGYGGMGMGMGMGAGGMGMGAGGMGAMGGMPQQRPVIQPNVGIIAR